MTDRKTPEDGRLVGLIQASSETLLVSCRPAEDGTETRPELPLNATARLTMSVASREGWFRMKPPVYVPALPPATWFAAVVPDVSPRRHQATGVSVPITLA